MALPWIGGFSFDGGRKDEPDLRLGNNGFYVSSDLFTDKNIEENRRFIQKEENRRPLDAVAETGPRPGGFFHGAAVAYLHCSLLDTVSTKEARGFDDLIFKIFSTLYKKTKDCKPFVNVLIEGGVRPGIKVNKSTIKVAGKHYDDPGKCRAKHYEAGAHFTKWQIYGNIGNLVGNCKDIFMMSMGHDFGSEGTFATHTTGGNHQSTGADLVTNHKPEFILDTGAEVNVTGDEAIFFALSFDPKGFGLRAANNSEMESYLCGYLTHPMYQMNYVYFSDDVGRRTIVSGPQLDVLGYSSKFEGGTCKVRDPETGLLVGEGRLVDNKKYLMDYLKIPLDRVPVQVPNVEDVPLPDGPVGRLSVFTPLWTAIRTLLRRFSGSLLKKASEEAPRRPPV